MRDRQRRRFSWAQAAAWSPLGAAWIGGVVYLRFVYNRFDIIAAAVVVSLVIVTTVAIAATVVCRFIVSNHEQTRAHQARTRRLEAESPNVVPIRREPAGEETMILPTVAVGRVPKDALAPGGGAPARPGRHLSYTAGDFTIDCALRDALEQDDTG